MGSMGLSGVDMRPKKGQKEEGMGMAEKGGDYGYEHASQCKWLWERKAW